MRIPKGKGDGAVAPSLGGTGAAVDGGASTEGTGARDDEVVAPSAATLSCDMPTSTHVGELRRAALRRSMRACRSVGVTSGREELHEVTVAGCPEFKTPEPNLVSRWERIRGVHGKWVGSARHPWRSNGNKREMSRSAPTWRANCRRPDPGVRIPTSKCCVFPRPR